MADIQEKVDLNIVTHSVRSVQAVLQYGVGAMVDFPDQTLLTAAPEYWNNTDKIYDQRFAKALGVNYFAKPTDISYVRFPEWYFCPKCRKFQSIYQWFKEYRKYAHTKSIERDEFMVRNVKCPKCHQDLVVTRIVTICEKGHLNDFPWVNWVHAKSNKKVCNEPTIYFKTGPSGSEGLEGLSISCSCGAMATLAGAFDKDVFQRLDDEHSNMNFKCNGHHPHLHIKEGCNLYPRAVQRGASSVYFPLVHSSLVIPPYADKINSRIEKSNGFSMCQNVIDDEEPENRSKLITERISKWAQSIAMEIGLPLKEVRKNLEFRWLNPCSKDSDVTAVKYRAEEYEALSGQITSGSGSYGDFLRESMPIEDYEIPHLHAVSLIHKVRVVHALMGFSRVQPVSRIEDGGFVSAKEKESRWYPAYDVHGEGLFIEFIEKDLENWIKMNPEVTARAKLIDTNYSSSFVGQSNYREITPKFVLLHTIGHLLIQQLSFECGYSVASLSERIYCASTADGKQMAGIFIYTANGDSEGTLGGLVRQGRADALNRIFEKAVKRARFCSNDPVCLLSHGQGRESLNLAACHACALLPETCCEERNCFLDRGFVIGTYENKKLGFFGNNYLL